MIHAGLGDGNALMENSYQVVWANGSGERTMKN